ncbi:MAG: malto-oligosyltrehalose synthase [Nitrospira sp. CR1.2]|nr:malto-oligosyltrehalose synthase [Nitrospira sp. CR1.2]
MPRIPLATYRLQFNRDFTFSDAARLVPYLHALGMTDCYASSFLKAVPGSLHGYDLIDPGLLNPELGSERDFAAFAAALKSHDMGLLVDVVPNHMGILSAENRWWWDVLENGPGARYASAFDIDWTPLKRELNGKVLLPILGEQYGTALEQQDIRLACEDGGFVVTYFQHRLPIAPASWANILSFRIDQLAGTAREEHPAVQELRSIVTALRHLPPACERSPECMAERDRETQLARRRLAALMSASLDVREYVRTTVERYNGMKGVSDSFDHLDGLLNEQHYRLASWRVASEEINYRRFFDVNELAAIRTEDPRIFEESHRLIFRLIKEGVATGLRIDHVDGLYDPEHYLRQLQDWAATELPPPGGEDRPSLFIVVEKILGTGEQLPRSWPAAGTTGYDFLNLLTGLFVRTDQAKAMDAVYRTLTGQRQRYEELVYQAKKLIMRASMSSELNVLGHELNRLSERDRHYRDFTLNSLTHAVREIIACFPVYRSYVRADCEDVLERDRRFIHQAVACAVQRNPALNRQVFDFVRDLLLGSLPPSKTLTNEERVRFVTKFQQTTGPVMAKGVEDTVCYLYNRLVSLNEVGGEPGRFGCSLEQFHQGIRERRAGWPHALSATSTHDTKRGEDVRARLNVLSEIPDRWRKAAARWMRMNKRHRIELDEGPAPERNVEYLLYQTLIGAWPVGALDAGRYQEFVGRIERYMIKAVREAKVRTSWVNSHDAYEGAIRGFIKRVLERRPDNSFLAEFLPFQNMVAKYGMSNSLSMVVLKVAAPGIPDCYQGTELWDLTLVDPDNRAPVDYVTRESMMAECLWLERATDADRLAAVQAWCASWEDGRIKMYVLSQALRHRQAQPDLYLSGDYVPLAAHGRYHSYLCAFARLHQDQAIVVIAPRFRASMEAQQQGSSPDEVWRDTSVTIPSWKPGSVYRHLFTGERFETTGYEQHQVLSVGAVLRHCPVGLLIRSEP